jgi:formate hydrogenlyase subunit 3/multisubunit Na+/H+ antiporter MnhD subunit
MNLVNWFEIVTAVAVTSLFFVTTKAKGFITLLAILANSLISGIIAVEGLTGNPFQMILPGTLAFGEVPLKIDALSAWFILTINFTMITGTIYGLGYMKQYAAQKNNLTLHWINFILLHASLVSICAVQNSMAFLMVWEIMALSSFVTVIFESYKAETLKAGINYLIQSHISIVFLMLAFIFIAFKTGSYDFKAIADFTSRQPLLTGTILFLFFFIGFGFKAGFVPFHTWLPYAHPVAPSHVSGVMSGIVIKIGIYGILRMLLLVHSDYEIVGFIILFISIISGLYGVMLAIIQHNLKRLLAYHSIENIGIIGIGIGIGCIGLGLSNQVMVILGFTGALLHTLNHSLFKSVLFYSAGNVYKLKHTMGIEKLGGLIKRMPYTALFFLIAAIAICGLPPLNGFVSEFLIYNGIYTWFKDGSVLSLIVVNFAILALVMIGGLAILCFTKAFGIVFLGTPREGNNDNLSESGFWNFFPLGAAALLMIGIGFFPSVFIDILRQPVSLFSGNLDSLPDSGILDSLRMISLLSFGLIAMVILILGIKKISANGKTVSVGPTWGCGYVGSSPKLQYTANSYARTYMKLAKPFLDIHKEEVEITEIFPSKKKYETHPYDKVERFLVDLPVKAILQSIKKFLFLQNGQIQRYILYGIIFIAAVICIPPIIDGLISLIHFINQM